MSKQHLLTPYNKNINLNNRVVMAPMTRGRADNEGNVPTDELHGVLRAGNINRFNYYRRQVSRDAVVISIQLVFTQMSK
jgi:N-ethylmaleimide reductase